MSIHFTLTHSDCYLIVFIHSDFLIRNIFSKPIINYFFNLTRFYPLIATKKFIYNLQPENLKFSIWHMAFIYTSPFTILSPRLCKPDLWFKLLQPCIQLKLIPIRQNPISDSALSSYIGRALPDHFFYFLVSSSLGC